MERKPIPVACTLVADAAAAQLSEWSSLVAEATSVRRTAAGAALTFALPLEARVQDLADRERACCAFLAITTERSGSELLVEITSPDPEGRAVVDLLVGLDGRSSAAR